VLHVVAGILRRGEDIVLVRQARPGEEPHWSLPAGLLEDEELLTEGLAREVREETGVRITDSGRIAFTVQLDDRVAGRNHTIWTFDVTAPWEGTLHPDDPDGLVLEAALVNVRDAVGILGRNYTQELLVRYLRGDLEPGSLVLQRWHADGRVETVWATLG
jgi:ADP-ribose pyrophosphatase YjhB (NUDIX family)